MSSLAGPGQDSRVSRRRDLTEEDHAGLRNSLYLVQENPRPALPRIGKPLTFAPPSALDEAARPSPDSLGPTRPPLALFPARGDATHLHMPPSFQILQSAVCSKLFLPLPRVAVNICIARGVVYKKKSKKINNGK